MKTLNQRVQYLSEGSVIQLFSLAVKIVVCPVWERFGAVERLKH